MQSELHFCKREHMDAEMSTTCFNRFSQPSFITRDTRKAWREDGTMQAFVDELNKTLVLMSAYATDWARRTSGSTRLLQGPGGEPASPDSALTPDAVAWRKAYHHLVSLVAQSPALFVDVRETVECAVCLGVYPNAAPLMGGEKLCEFCKEEAAEAAVNGPLY